MNDGSLMTMGEIRAALEARLAHEKARLVAAIAGQFDDEGRAAGEFGARGRMRSAGVAGEFYVNCSRRGEPWEDTGHGKGQLAHYFWIPVVYRDGACKAGYVLSLGQDDLDVSTGNVHACFGRLQFTRLSHVGSGIGGQANPKPEPADGGYLLHYRADDHFPRAVRAYGDDWQPRTVLGDDRPWGHAGFERQAPVMDLADPAYDPQAIAAFFMRLVVCDLRA